MRPRTSKPLVGILGDLEGWIGPVAPRPVLDTILTTSFQVWLPAEAGAAISTV